MAGKSTRITVDLGSEELVKALKIAAVEKRRTVRDIVVEALSQWLERSETSASGSVKRAAEEASQQQPSDKDYVSMMETLNRYRGLGQK